jgi:hypothetical protein
MRGMYEVIPACARGWGLKVVAAESLCSRRQLSQDFLDSLEESEGWKLSGGQKDIKGKGIMKTYVLSKLGRCMSRPTS